MSYSLCLKENFIENGYNTKFCFKLLLSIHNTLLLRIQKNVLSVQNNIEVGIAINNTDNRPKENFLETDQTMYFSSITLFICLIN